MPRTFPTTKFMRTAWLVSTAAIAVLVWAQLPATGLMGWVALAIALTMLLMFVLSFTRLSRYRRVAAVRRRLDGPLVSLLLGLSLAAWVLFLVTGFFTIGIIGSVVVGFFIVVLAKAFRAWSRICRPAQRPAGKRGRGPYR